MLMSDPKSQIREYLERVTRHPDLRDDQAIFDEGIVNSLFAVELVLFIEKEFSVTVENDDLELANFASIDAIATFVARKIGAA